MSNKPPVGDRTKIDLLAWIVDGEPGVSAHTVVLTLLGHTPEELRDEHEYSIRHPDSLREFRVCRKLLRDVPGVRENFDSMRSVSESWRIVVDHWDEIETAYLSAVRTGRRKDFAKTLKRLGCGRGE